MKDGKLKDKYFLVPLAARESSCTRADTTTHKYYNCEELYTSRHKYSENPCFCQCRTSMQNPISSSPCSDSFKKPYQVTKQRDQKTSLFLFTIRNQNIQNVWRSKQPCTHFLVYIYTKQQYYYKEKKKQRKLITQKTVEKPTRQKERKRQSKTSTRIKLCCEREFWREQEREIGRVWRDKETILLLPLLLFSSSGRIPSLATWRKQHPLLHTHLWSSHLLVCCLLPRSY